MKRITTDTPQNNTEILLNYAYAKGGRVYLRHADGRDHVDLAKYIADNACCPYVNEEAVMEGSCLECNGKTSLLYTVAVQAAELRGRLKAYEDTGFMPEDLSVSFNAAVRKRLAAEYYGLTPEQMDHAVDLFMSEGSSTLMILPCKAGSVVWLIDRRDIPRMSKLPLLRCTIDEYVNDGKATYAVLNGADTWHMFRRFKAVSIDEFGKTVFCTLEEAESAVKRR